MLELFLKCIDCTARNAGIYYLFQLSLSSLEGKYKMVHLNSAGKIFGVCYFLGFVGFHVASGVIAVHFFLQTFYH